jgi:hypothetical protein
MDLSSEAAQRLDGIRTELDGLLAKLRSFLGKGAGGDLQQRLQPGRRHSAVDRTNA